MRLKTLICAAIAAILVCLASASFLTRQPVQPDRSPGTNKTGGVTATGRLSTVLDPPPQPGSYTDPRTSHTGVRYDEPIAFLVGSDRFDIPAAYLVDWPTSSMVGKLNADRADTGIEFIFWIPDKRPLVTKTYPALVDARPREMNKPPARDDEFGVLIREFKIIVSDAQGYVSPEHGMRNISAVRSNNRDSVSEEFGLLKVKFGLDIGKDLAFTYANKPGTRTQIYLRCNSDEEVFANPQCSGSAQFPDNIRFHLRFSRHALPRWQEVINAARELGLSWRVMPRGGRP